MTREERRDMFAAAALNRQLANSYQVGQGWEEYIYEHAAEAREIADAMLAELDANPLDDE